MLFLVCYSLHCAFFLLLWGNLSVQMHSIVASRLSRLLKARIQISASYMYGAG